MEAKERRERGTRERDEEERDEEERDEEERDEKPERGEEPESVPKALLKRHIIYFSTLFVWGSTD